ncbi:glycosyltransferase family 62 [Geosmithia morbida]|uniref:Glycosyltransferase family 62 n=1 Tax=Geosmithia morbida TaxID=1094350 RepID=A0A9P4YU54_9HYPO|nr:glycosyltransferase family 62 [Geosmithia morbida]KAF4121079.1 glycosyltransferase family 62 [Geosmithia morbida]
MLLPKGGLQWKTARARAPQIRVLWNTVSKPRFLLFCAVFGIIALLWRGISSSASEMQSFYCWGPAKSPLDMTQNEYSRWNAHMQTPVIFNRHKPLKVDSSTIEHVDLNPIKSTHKAVINEEKILILTPVKDASPYLSKYFELLVELTYPHHLIDLGFLVSDSSDDTLAVLASELDRIQKRPDNIPFNSATIVEKDFHFILPNDVEQRHAFPAQGPRRKALGQARNYLLSTTLKPDHSWVYWRDVDIVDSPDRILEDLIAHDKDIVVPNIWFHRYENGVDIEGRFDYNSWVETEQSRKLTANLDKDVILAEGYPEYYDTGRTYMAKMGDWRDDPNEEIELDGVGGVSILVKADVHRSGINFPCYAFENQAETEGFAKMAKRAGYSVVGLPNYVVWHIDTDEKPR